MISVDNINKLPVIIIKKIISLISNNRLTADYFQLTLIDKKWNKYCKETIHFLEFNNNDILDLPIKILSSFKSTSTLSLKQCKLNLSKLSKLIKSLENLIELNILYCNFLNNNNNNNNQNENENENNGNNNLKEFINDLKDHSNLINLELAFNQIELGLLNQLKSLVNLPEYFKIKLTIKLMTSNSTIGIINEIMSGNKSILCSLDLGRCKIGGKESTSNGFVGLSKFSNILKTITPLSLSSLDLSYNQLSNESAIILADGLSTNKSIQSLNLSFNDIKQFGSIAIAKALSINNSITSLQYSCNSLFQEGTLAFAEMISLNQSLTDLNLSNCKLSLSSSSTSSSSSSSTSSSPESSPESSSSIIIPTPTTTPTEISQSTIIAITKIGLTFKNSLGKNKSLKSLNLSRNLIDNQAVEYIAFGLSLNRSILNIDLSCNRIGDQGAKLLSKSIAYNENTMINTLNLSSNCIEDSGASSFSDIIINNKTLTQLDLSINWINSNGIIQLSKSFEVLSSSSSSSSSNCVSPITSIDFSCNTICHRGAKYIGSFLKNSNIKYLNLFSNNLEALGAIKLAKSFSLINDNINLTQLDLSSNSLGNYGVSVLANQLIKNKTIKSISLSQSLITSIESSNIQSTTNPSSPTTDDKNISIVVSDGVLSLVKLIKENNVIEFIDLSYNSIGAIGAKEISFALKSNKTITNLDLSCNSIGDIGATSIANQVFPFNNILSRLSLYNNKISSVGAKSIVDNLIKNHTLFTINLLANNIDNELLIPITKRLELLLPKN
ncbi:hypothetical protein ACTFIW_010932 [Dictyostelium discoideum]